MKPKIYPIIISTQEALIDTLTCDLPVIYVDECLYAQAPGEILRLMTAHRYSSAENMGKHGIFFIKSDKNNTFSLKQYEIYDPLEIL